MNRLLTEKFRSLISMRGFLYAALCAVIAVSFYGHMGSAFEYKTKQPSSSGAMHLLPSVEYSQKLRISDCALKSIGLNFGTYNRVNDGRLHVALEDDVQTIQSWTLHTAELADNAFHQFQLDKPFALASDETYYLSVRSDYDGDNGVALYVSDDGGSIFVDGIKQKNASFCCQYTLVNAAEKSRYQPIYMAALIAVLLFAAVFVDFHSYSILKAVGICAAVLLFIRMADYDLFQNFATSVNTVDFQQTELVDTVASGSCKEYGLAIKGMQFDSISFVAEGSNIRNLRVRLTERNSQKIYFDRSLKKKDYISDGTIGKRAILLNLQKNMPAGDYLLTICNNGKKDIQINVLDSGALNFCAARTTFLAHKIAMLIVFILAFSLVFLCGYAIHKFRVERIFLSLVVPLSVVYMILFLPWSQPDTGGHIRATYRLSNLLLGYGGELEWQRRADDQDFLIYSWGRDTNPSIRSYSEVTQNLHLWCVNRSLVDADPMEHMKYYSLISYLPGVIGISLGRVLNLSSVLTIYLGRIFVLILYIALTYRAVKRIPIGKSIVATVSLLPMSLMMSSAISYDTIVIVSTLNFIASVFCLYKNGRSKPALAEAMLWAFVVGATKGGGYLVLLPLAFVLLSKEDKRHRISQVAVVLASGLVSVILFDVILPGGEQLFQFGTGNDGRLSATFALAHPLQFIDMSLESYLRGLDVFAIGMGGTHLAWLEWVLPSTVIVLLLLIGGICSIFEKDEANLRRFDKVIFCVTLAIGIVTVPIMLLSWTPVGTRWIEGLQGRYFLPFLPLAIMIMTKFSLHHPLEGAEGKAIRGKLAVWFMAVSCLAVYFMLRTYMTR